VSPMPFHKYAAYPRVELPDRTWPDRRITAAPVWASVDLRDGNQALDPPMDTDRKRRLFDVLVNRVGLKEVEVGFPAAAQAEFEFMRILATDSQRRDGDGADAGARGADPEDL
jgi:2-isopropylmalate synthase